MRPLSELIACTTYINKGMVGVGYGGGYGLVGVGYDRGRVW